MAQRVMAVQPTDKLPHPVDNHTSAAFRDEGSRPVVDATFVTRPRKRNATSAGRKFGESSSTYDFEAEEISRSTDYFHRDSFLLARAPWSRR
jgi:hypothetical protein